MPLVSELNFREAFNFRDLSISITDYLSAASAEIQSWVGAEVYEEAEVLLQEEAPEPSPELQRARRLKLAETYLTMSFAYPILSVQIESGVVVLTDRSEGALERRFPTPKEIGAGSQLFYDRAVELAQPYVLADAAGGDEPPVFLVVSA